jgi:glycosyltransferase involved in cell wall biosynthesis
MSRVCESSDGVRRVTISDHGRVSSRRKLRIGIDLTGLWREATGIFVAASNLAHELIRCDNDNQYTLFFSGNVHDDFCELPSNARTITLPTQEEVISKQIFLGALCNTLRLDVIHFPALPPALSCYRPFIWTLHDATPWLFPETMDLKGRLYFKWIGGLGARRSRLLVTDSEDAKLKISQALHIPDHKIRVIQPGIDVTFKKLADPDVLQAVRVRYRLPERFILVVATREPRKNLSTLVQAYRRMRSIGRTRLGLVIVGRVGWKSQDLESNLGKQDSIVLTGFVPQPDLVALYSLAHVFVLPSLYEGFGFPPLEAMACECPVIVSNRGSLPEVVGNAAVLVNPESPDSIIAAIQAVEDSQSLRADLVRRGVERVKTFSWAKAAAMTMGLYHEVAAH